MSSLLFILSGLFSLIKRLQLRLNSPDKVNNVANTPSQQVHTRNVQEKIFSLRMIKRLEDWAIKNLNEIENRYC